MYYGHPCWELWQVSLARLCCLAGAPSSPRTGDSALWPQACLRMGAEALDSMKAGLELEGRGVDGSGLALVSSGTAAGEGAIGSVCASPGGRMRGIWASNQLKDLYKNN